MWYTDTLTDVWRYVTLRMRVAPVTYIRMYMYVYDTTDAKHSKKSLFYRPLVSDESCIYNDVQHFNILVNRSFTRWLFAIKFNVIFCFVVFPSENVANVS